MNSVNLIGRLAQDPEPKATKTGAKMAALTIAVKRQIVKKSENTKDVDYIDCIAWQKSAEIILNYCKKGSLIGIYGKIITNTYEKNGETRKSQEILVNEVYILDKKKPEPAPKAEAAPDDGQLKLDLPFEVE